MDPLTLLLWGLAALVGLYTLYFVVVVVLISVILKDMR